MRPAANTSIRGRESEAQSVGTVLFVILLVMMENCFYLIDVDSINIAGFFNYNLIWQFYCCVLIVAEICWLASKKSWVRVPFWGAFAFILLTIVVAAVRCQQLTGQPLANGLFPQRGYALMTLCFFFVYPAIVYRLIDVQKVLTAIVVLGCFASALYLAQALLGSSVSFVHVNVNERYGSSRLYVDSMFCIMGGLIGFSRLLKTRKVRYLVSVAMLFAYELFVSKGRLELVSVVCALMVCFLFSRGGFDAKALVLVLAFFALVVFFCSDYGAEVFENLLGASSDGSYLIRLEGREYYASRLAESWESLVFGCGYPSELYAPATYFAGFSYNYFLVDNGFFAYAFVYGLLGLVPVIIVWVKMLVQSVRFAFRGGSPLYLMYVCLSLVMAQNIIFWWWQRGWMLLLPLMFCSLMCEAGELSATVLNAKHNDARRVTHGARGEVSPAHGGEGM